MKKTRYEVECDVRDIAEEIAKENDLEKEFYGDCYPIEIMEIERDMSKCNDDLEYQELLHEAKEIFENCIGEVRKWQ